MRTLLLIALALVIVTVSPALARHGCDGYRNPAYNPYYVYGYNPYYGAGAYPYAADYYDPYYGGRPYRRSRRNAALGAAVFLGLANEAFNRGRSRRDLRRVAVGLGVLGALSGGGRRDYYY